ncbi:MAG: hypothetical protein ACE5E5_09260 [Phycisphaerae bacterium]
MNAAKCRVILKPSDLTPEQCAQLRERLQSAVLWQQELAGKSPHVLQFEGDLQESDTAFLIAHEPADAAWDAVALFDSKSPEIDDPKSLVRLAAALLDALKYAHGGSNPQLRAHGGLCPGVLLISPDGVEKTTDFGFARAFCGAAGYEAYLNLAIGPNPALAQAHNATGVWEVLSTDEFEREDRLCAFVDPEKYGTATFEGFEPGSDIIAAGFILHLIAEHRHPYLLDPEAHRLVELAEIMSMTRYNGARRKDLRESSEPAIVAWCDLVAKMLERIPANRPAAAEGAAALAEYVPRVDQGEILRRKVEKVRTLAEQGVWQELRAALVGIPDNEAAPDDVREEARALLQLADANVLLDRAIDVLKTEQWPQAKEPLDQVLALPALPQAVADRARKASGLLEHNSGIRDRLDAIRSRIQSASKDDPEAARDALEEVVTQAQALATNEDTFPLLKESVQRLADEAGEQLESLQAEIERIEAERREEEAKRERQREAARKQAQAWCDLLEASLAAEKWEALADQLEHKPSIDPWPEPIDTRASEIAAALAAHLAEEERKAAEKADRQVALKWIGPVQDAAGREAWDDVERQLEAKPDLRFFPEDVAAQGRELHNRLTKYRKQERDRLQAEEYVKRLTGLIDRESWVEAADLLGHRPTLEFWPEASLSEETRHREQVEAHLEAIELQKRQTAAWLESAEAARRANRLAEAIQTLQSPPLDRSRLPAEAQSRATELLKECQEALAEQRKQELKARTQAIQDTVARFLTSSVAQSLDSFVQSTGLDLSVGGPVFDDPDTPVAGRVSAEISLKTDTDESEAGPVSVTLPFAFDKDTPELIDESTQRDVLVQGVARLIGDRQLAALPLVIDGLQKGVFPKAELVAHFDPPSADVSATLHLMGRESENGTLTAALCWDSKGLRWGFDDAASVASGVLQEAAKSMQTALPQQLLTSFPELKAYESRVTFDAVPGELGPVAQMPEVLPLRARLSLRNDDGVVGSPIADVALPLRIAGTIPDDFDAKPLVAALNKRVVAAQASVREEMLTDLKRRVSEADAKAKVWTTPAKIIEPTGAITFELGRKKRKPIARLQGKWQTDDFRYVLDEPYDNAIARLKDAAKSGPKKPGMALVGILVAVLGAGGYFGSTLINSRRPAPPDLNENVNASQPDNPTFDTYLAETAARNVMKQCRLLKNAGVSELITSQMASNGDSATLTCTIPGLAEPSLTVPLRLKQKNGTNWVLPTEAEAELKTRVDSLCALSAIGNEALQQVRDALLESGDWAALSPFLDPSALSYDLDATKQTIWRHDQDMNRWTRLVPGYFRAGREGDRLVDFDTQWHIQDGELSRSTDDQAARDNLKAAISRRLQELQAQSSDALRRELAKTIDNGHVAELPDLISLRTDLGLHVSVADTVARTFRAAWNRSTLRFDPEASWKTRARFAAAASAALALVNEDENGNRALSEANWLNYADKRLVEQQPPETGLGWRLMVAALWSKQVLDPVDVRDLPDDQRLVVTVPLEQPAEMDAASLAALIAKSKPKYWPIAEAYAVVRSDAFFTRNEMFEDSFARALGLVSGDLPHCAVSMTLHDERPLLTRDPAGLIQGAALPLDAWWSAVAAPDGLPLEAIRAGIEALNEKFPLILTLGIDSDGELTAEWDQEDMTALGASLPKMRALEAVLADLPARAALESEFLGKLEEGGGGGAVGKKVELDSAEALELLGKIRAIKGVAPPAEQDLLTLFESLENVGLFAKRGVVPSLFVEYFCGPQYCFAIAGGLIDDSNDTPVVHAYALKLCPSTNLLAANGGNLGNQLLGAIWTSFAEVLSPMGQVSDPNRSHQVGIVLGMDKPMALLDLPKLPFDKQEG